MSRLIRRALLPGALGALLSGGWRLTRSALLTLALLGLVACEGVPDLAQESPPVAPGTPTPGTPRTNQPPPAVTLDAFTAFVNRLESALETNDDALLKDLMGTPWFSGRFQGEVTQYTDVANALGAFHALRQGALISIDPNRVASERASTQTLGERTLVARWVGRSGGETLAYLYLGKAGNQWRWTALISNVPDTLVAAQPSGAATPSGDAAVGNGYLVFVYDHKVMMRELSTNAESIVIDTANGQRTQWDWTHDGVRAVFVQDDELWDVNRDGSGLHQLTNEHVAVSAPRWSADGAQILFERNVQSDHSGLFTFRGEVWLINADGSGQHKLVDGFDPAWAPNGQRVAFASNAQYIKGDAAEWTSYARNSIHLINVQGRNEWSPLTTEMPSAKFTAMEWQLNNARLLDQPQWSPDGREIAVRANSNNGAYVTTDANSGGLTKFIALYFDSVAHSFSYSPDGASVALGLAGLSGWDTIGVYRRSSISRDGISGVGLRTLGKVPKQSGDIGQKVVLYAWSPDSARIAAVVVTYPNNDLSQPPASSAIWITDVASGAERQLTSGTGPLFWFP